MGQYYKVVNLDKRQYFSPDIFNDGVKLGAIMKGTHPYVIGQLLLANNDTITSNNKASKIIQSGYWAGDRVIFVGDESGEHFFNVASDNESRDYQILNDLVVTEFENIGARLFCSFINDIQFKELILKELQENSQYFGQVGYLVYQHQNISQQVHKFLIENFGANWEKAAREIWNDPKTTFIEFNL